MYAEEDFAMRLVSAFEAVLDPLVATLDNLPDHFRGRRTRRATCSSCSPTGSRSNATSCVRARSAGASSSALPELMRLRGTKRRACARARARLPGVPFRIEDAGGVSWSLDPDAAWKAIPPAFVIYCDMPLAENRLAAVARLIDQAKPAHVAYRLRVRAAEPEEEGGA